MQAVSSSRSYDAKNAAMKRPSGARYDGTAALQYENENVAYDLTRFDQRSRVRRAVSADEADRTEVRTQRAVKTAAAARISPFSVMGFVVIMGLLFMIVYSYMRDQHGSTRPKTICRIRFPTCSSNMPLCWQDLSRKSA